eukprot:718300-Ditylum_brightwellii.AAC.1
MVTTRMAGHPVFSTRNEGWQLMGEKQEKEDKIQAKILKQETHCKICAKKKAINIMGNVADEYSSDLKSALNIGIPQKNKMHFKEHYHFYELSQVSNITIQEDNNGVSTNIRLV